MGVAVRRVSRTYVHVNQPLVAQLYNQHYKSIDLFDQHMAAYPVSRRTYRSWKHIFWFCFQASVINSYIIYRETNPGPLPKTYSHIDFRILLAKQLIGNFSTRQVNPITRPLFVGLDASNEQLMNYQNTKLEPPTIRVCRPHKQYNVRNAVYIAYYVKRRYYGAKVLLTVRDRSSNSTVIHVVAKIRSEVEIAMFHTLLQGVKDAVYQYVNTGSDSSE